MNSGTNLEKNFNFPDITNKKVLVLGIGGGCDAITAFSIAQECIKYNPNEIYYGNSIGPRKLDGWIQQTQFIFSSPIGDSVPILYGDNCNGSVRIEESLPRSSNGSPYIFMVPFREGNIQDTTKKNKEALVSDITEMKFDFIFGVDAGGDSLTGGIDWKLHPSLGRDRQMLTILSSIPNTVVYHFLVAPCCDGETTHKVMQYYLDVACLNGHYRGCFSVDSLIPILKNCSKSLSETRTPNIIVNAYEKKLEYDPPNQNLLVRIYRGLNPTVPIKWLTTCFVFEWPQNMDPCYCLLDNNNVKL